MELKKNIFFWECKEWGFADSDDINLAFSGIKPLRNIIG